MFLRSRKHLRKTVGFKLAVWYSGIFILSSLLLFSLAYFFLLSSLKKQDKESIELKLRELSALYESGGMETLEREVTVGKKFEKKNSTSSSMGPRIAFIFSSLESAISGLLNRISTPDTIHCRITQTFMIVRNPLKIKLKNVPPLKETSIVTLITAGFTRRSFSLPVYCACPFPRPDGFLDFRAVFHYID